MEFKRFRKLSKAHADTRKGCDPLSWFNNDRIQCLVSDRFVDAFFVLLNVSRSYALLDYCVMPKRRRIALVSLLMTSVRELLLCSTEIVHFSGGIDKKLLKALQGTHTIRYANFM